MASKTTPAAIAAPVRYDIRCSPRNRSRFFILLLVVLVAFVVAFLLLHSPNTTVIRPARPLPATATNSEPVPLKETDVSRNKESYKALTRGISANYPSTVENQWITKDEITFVRRTAFYDVRPQFGRSVVIVIMHHHLKSKEVPQFHAKVVMSSKESFCSLVQHWKQTGTVVTQWHDVVLNHVLRIPLSNPLHEGEPVSIQLTDKSNCDNSTLWPIMPVYYDKRPKRNETFVTCLQKALFSKISPGDLVNFVELNRALGASIITVFFSVELNDPEKVYKAIEPYVKTGIVEVIGWSLKPNWNEEIFDLGMAGSATECVYRNINRARYMALHDIDEFLIPLKHKTWAGMIKELRSTIDLNEYASLQFGSALLSEEVESGPPPTKCKVPVYFTRYNRDGDPKMSHPKAMVDLDTTITAYCHDIKTWKDGVQKTYTIPKQVGACYHYRRDLGPRYNVVKNWIHDTTVNRYKSEIIAAIEKHSCVTE